MTQPTQIKVIGKVGQIMQLFRDQGPELRLQDIAQGTALDATTVTRIVTSLCQVGMLRFDEVQRLYSPGLIMVELSRLVISRFAFHELVHRELLALSSERKWPGYLGVLSEGDYASVVYLDAVTATPGVTPVTSFGERLPAYSTASGKLLLALNYVDPDTLDLRPRTSATHIDADLLREEFAQIRKSGYSTTEGEEQDGYCGVAAPIYDLDGVVAAIGLETSCRRFPAERDDMIRLAVAKAQGISAAVKMRAGSSRSGLPERQQRP